jgi:hypothetical protein
MHQATRPAALGRGKRAGKISSARALDASDNRLSAATRQAILETLRQEEARLSMRINGLSLADPDDRAEARDIRERLRDIRAERADMVGGA